MSSKRAHRRRRGRRRQRDLQREITELVIEAATFKASWGWAIDRATKAEAKVEDHQKKLEDNPIFRAMVERRWEGARGDLYGIEVLLRPEEFRRIACESQMRTGRFGNVSHEARMVAEQIADQTYDTLMKYIEGERKAG